MLGGRKPSGRKPSGRKPSRRKPGRRKPGRRGSPPFDAAAAGKAGRVAPPPGRDDGWMSGVGRRDELAAAVAATEDRIAAAARDAGRERSELTLVAVSKTWPASDVLLLAALGLGDFGENRAQEGVRKAAEVAVAGVEVRWHFVGRLQRNKCRAVAGFAALVHSVDRAELVAGLAAGALDAGRVLDVLLQVGLDGHPGRGGAPPGEIARLADGVAASPSLRLRGVMAVAPLGAPPRPAFARLRTTADALRRDHPDAVIISAGMSEDFADAVAEGATHLRIGSALFGKRPAVP